MGVTGGILLGAAEVSLREGTLTVALVRALQHELFADGSGQPNAAALEHLNDLRTARLARGRRFRPVAVAGLIGADPA